MKARLDHLLRFAGDRIDAARKRLDAARKRLGGGDGAQQRRGRWKPVAAADDDDLLQATIDELDMPWRLTPERLVRVISSADSGDPRDQAALFDWMVEKETRIQWHLQTRRLAVLSRPWEVRSESRPELALQLTDGLRTAGLQKALSWLLEAVAVGYSGVIVDWLPGAAGITGFRPIAKGSFVFDAGGNPAITGADLQHHALASFPPGQVMYMRNYFASGLPCRAGLLRTLLWLHVFKSSSFRGWNRFLERFGMPFVMGKIPSGDFQDASKRRELMTSLLAIRSEGAGVGTTETEMQLINAAGSGDSARAYEAHQRYCDETATLLILGQLASSDRGSGLSQGGMQEEVRQDLLESDAAALAEVVNNGLLRWLLQYAHGISELGDLQFVIDAEDAEDLNIKSERDERIVRATGLPLTREYAMRTYGIELAEQPRFGGGFGFGVADGSGRERAAAVAATGGRGSELAASDGVTDGAAIAAAMDTRTEQLVQSTLRRLLDDDAMEVFREVIDEAIRRHFSDLDEDSETLIADFTERTEAFFGELPWLMDEVTATGGFEDALTAAMTAAYANGLLPAGFVAGIKVEDGATGGDGGDGKQEEA